MADSIGGVSDLDRQIEQLRRCEIIKESEVSCNFGVKYRDEQTLIPRGR